MKTEEDTVTMMAPCHLKLSRPPRKCLIAPILGDALEVTNNSLKAEEPGRVESISH